MKIVDLIQGSQQWLAWRSCGIGASDTAAIVGVSPYKSRWALWMERRFALTAGAQGRSPEGDNPFMHWGKSNEDRIRQSFERAHNDILLPACAEHEAMPFLRASFDGLTSSAEPVEMKAPSAKMFRDMLVKSVESTPYLYHWWQVQHQLLVADKSHGWLVLWLSIERTEDGLLVVHGQQDQELKSDDPIAQILDGTPLRDGMPSRWQLTKAGSDLSGWLWKAADGSLELTLECRIAADQASQKKLLADGQQFWESVERGDEPPKDPARDPFEPVDPVEQAEWENLAQVRRALVLQEQALASAEAILADRRRLIDRGLLTIMGDARSAACGGLKVTRFPAGSVDWKRVIADGVCAKSVVNAARSPDSVEVRVFDQAKLTGGDAVYSPVTVDEDEPDPSPVVTETEFMPNEAQTEQWMDLAAQRRPVDRQLGILRRERQIVQERREAVEARLAEMMGPFATASFAGLRISRFLRRGRISTAKVVKLSGLDRLALNKYREPSARYRISQTN